MEENASYSMGHVDIFNENLSQQLSEVEILQSMFPSSQEFQLDPSIFLNDVESWMENSSSTKTDLFPPLIEFTICLSFEKNKVEVVVTLPIEYPAMCLPEIYVRSNTLSRTQQTLINKDLLIFLETEAIESEPCLIAVILWLQEKGEEYFTEENKQSPEPAEKIHEKNFSRYWIYSHHIYSKIKRKNLLDLSAEFQLTGFSMPGKPGVICVEGFSRNCTEFWSLVKHWNWKKINVKIQEEEQIENDVDSHRRFGTFEEIGTVKNPDSRNYHMDLGEFYRFLESHQSSYMFKELFGVDKNSV